MSEPSEELKQSAAFMAWKSLCLSLFETHPDKAAVIADFIDRKERSAAMLLNDPNTHDTVQAAIDSAFQYVLTELKKSASSKPT